MKYILVNKLHSKDLLNSFFNYEKIIKYNLHDKINNLYFSFY